MSTANPPTTYPTDETTTTITEAVLFPSEFAVGDYVNNPRIVSAGLVDETTIRVLLSQPVRVGKQVKKNGVTYTKNEKTFRSIQISLQNLSRDNEGLVYGSVVDISFSESLTPGGELTFEDTSARNGPVLGGALYAPGGAGLIATGENKATVTVSENASGVDNTEVRLISASVNNSVSGQFEMVFNVPVRAVTDWTYITFVSDTQYPNPGVGGSWQFNITDVKAVDPQVKDGKTYATTWTFRASLGNQILPQNGVIRIMENDAGAPEEFQSPNDNKDLSRVVVSIDGKGLDADDWSGWDVAYVRYE